MVEYTAIYQSPVGTITLASDGSSLTGLWLEGQKYFAATLDAQHEQAALPVFADAGQWLDAYFAGQKPACTVPLAPKGSAFRQAVWKKLLEIPYGQTVTYGKLADELARQGMPTAARAVGGAVGHNPISIIIPCHRVVGANGSLTGYAGGLTAKRKLLELEGI